MGIQILQGDSGSISHFPSEGSSTLSMNNHRSYKSVCFGYVIVTLYRNDAVIQ